MVLVFCADCFEIHQKEMHLIADGKKSDAKKWGNHIGKFIKINFIPISL